MAEDVLQGGFGYQGDYTWQMTWADLQAQVDSALQPDNGIGPVFLQALMKQAHSAYVEHLGDSIHFTVPDFTPMPNPRSISQEEADVMCARHVLWLYDQGGEQADFSNCSLENLDLSRRRLNSALFQNARLHNVSLAGSELCFADFQEAFLWDCDGRDCVAEEANFRGAHIAGCCFDRAFLTHGDFSLAQVHNTGLEGANTQDWITDGAILDSAKNEQDCGPGFYMGGKVQFTRDYTG